MSLLERGFKTWAEKFAQALRREMEMELIDRMDLPRLARLFGARLCMPQDILGMSKEHLTQLLHKDMSGWSAVTVVTGTISIIIYNPSHNQGRIASDIAHEVAHLILEHEPTKLVLSQDGSLVMRSFNAKQEEEANWLAWCLLLPREALVSSLKRRLSVPDIADSFGISQTLVKFRIQMTGAQMQIRHYGVR
jgi:Zn-dependent peptidase ImmA (M78 family)